MPGFTMPALMESSLNRENIASRALSVAENTQTTGHCYAAVSRALRPLGVELSGAAAYQAQALLLADPRFTPLSIHNVDELRRGDIVVYTRSSSHPYGHISVYEGNYEEASDHVAPITHTRAYGSATVFRLHSDTFDDEPAIAVAPDCSAHRLCAQNRQASFEPAAPVLPPQSQAPRGHLLRNMFRSIRHDYSVIAEEPIERSLLRRCARLLLH